MQGLFGSPLIEEYGKGMMELYKDPVYKRFFNPTTFSRELKTLIADLNVTNNDFAKYINVSSQTLGNYLRGYTYPDEHKLLQMVKMRKKVDSLGKEKAANLFKAAIVTLGIVGFLVLVFSDND